MATFLKLMQPAKILYKFQYLFKKQNKVNIYNSIEQTKCEERLFGDQKTFKKVIYYF